MAETDSAQRPSPVLPRPRRSGAAGWLTGLVLAFGSAAGAYADSGETEEVQGTAHLANPVIGSAIVACLPGGECVDQTGVLLKGFDPQVFTDPQEVGDATGLEFGTSIQGTAFGSVEGRTVGGAAADRFCWTAPLTTTGGGPAFRKASGSLVCVEVRVDASCTATSPACGPTSCGNRSILVRSGQSGDSVCRTISQQLAQSVTFGQRNFEMIIGLDVERVGETGSITVATCEGFRPVCSDPAAPSIATQLKRTVPLAAVDTPKLVKMGGLWCDTNTGKCFP